MVEEKCVYKNASGQCVYDRDKNGKLQMTPEQTKKACENYKKIMDSNARVAAYGFGPGAAGRGSATLFGDSFGKVIFGAASDIGLIVGGVTALLGLSPKPEGCE